MALLLTSDDVRTLGSHQLALEAMRETFRSEAAGGARLPMRLDADSGAGFIRVMPAVLDRTMGLKVMTLVTGLGTRYLILLYAVDSGELLALLDADEVTRVRTAATTALAALHMVPEPPEELAVIGTGFEAQGHLEFFAELWPLRRVMVYSRSRENREQLADKLGPQLGLEIVPAPSMEAAVAETATVLLATKSSAPVVDGAAFAPGTVVLSIGSTRPDLRELDSETVRRAEWVVVDAVDQVLSESGDIIEAVAQGVLDRERMIPLAELCARRDVLPRPSGTRDLSVFKSAGTALQDLGLAGKLYQRARELGTGTEIGDVPRLKPFAKR